MFVLAFVGLRVVLAATREMGRRHRKNRLSRPLSVQYIGKAISLVSVRFLQSSRKRCLWH